MSFRLEPRFLLSQESSGAKWRNLIDTFKEMRFLDSLRSLEMTIFSLLSARSE